MASDRPAVNPSIVRIHFGSSAASPARGRARHWRAASSRSSAPSTSLSTSTQVAGSPSLAPAPPATSSTIVLTTASPRTHPARNAGPLRRPAGSASPTRSGQTRASGRRMPIFRWVPSYDRGWLRGDLIAGLTVWAVLVAEALAYATIAGVSPVGGLYAAPGALILYAAFG